MKANIGQPRGVGNPGASTGGKHDGVGGDDLVADLDLFVSYETGVVGEDGDIVERPPVFLATSGDRVNTAEDAFNNLGPPDVVDVGIDTERTCGAHGFHDRSWVDEHLRWDTPAVQACTAEHVSFHDGNVPVREVFGQDRVS